MSDLEIARDDIALSAIAAGNAPDSDDPTLLLLASFRADLDETAAGPQTVPSSPTSTVAPVVPIRSRRRSATLLALSAAAGVVFGGITAGAIAASDRPGEPLYAAHVAVFGKDVTATTEVTAEITAVLDRAAGTLASGDRAGARRLISRAATMIPTAPEADRAALLTRVDELLRYAADPVVRPTPRPTPSATRETPEPTESETDDNSGSGSNSGSNSGSGSDDPTDDPTDNSGSGSSNSGSSNSGSGKLETFDPDKVADSGSDDH